MDRLVESMGELTGEVQRAVAQCHAPNRFGTVNMEDNVNIKRS